VFFDPAIDGMSGLGGLSAVAWIAPLEIEVQAAKHMLDKVHTGGFPVGPGDDYLFHAGEIHRYGSTRA
jgi:hypothetical protein